MNRVSASLENLASGYLAGLYNPSRYEGFSVSEGAKTGKGGLTSGVLSKEDYATFKDIVKNVNVRDASYDEMSEVFHKLLDAQLVTLDQMLSIEGTVEFGKGGQINRDVKYDQMEYQRRQLPLYTTPETDATRAGAMDSFKVVAAIANASPLTGQTIARFALCESDRNSAVEVDLSEEARRRAREKNYHIDDPDPDKSKFMKELFEQMKKMAAAAKASENVRAAEAAAPGPELPPA